MKRVIHIPFFVLLFVISGDNLVAQGSDPLFPSQAANAPASAFTINDISFVEQDTGVAVGPGGLAWMTVDGGVNWSAIPTFTANSNNNAVYMEDEYICIAGDQGFVTFSKDRGTTWQNAAQAQPGFNYHGVDFADSTFGICVGDAGDAIVYRWSGGYGWMHIPAGVPNKFNAVAAFKNNSNPQADGDGIAVGNNGLVATYSNGSWTVKQTVTTTNLTGVYLFPDHTTVLAVGDNGLIMRSPDFGNTRSILNFDPSKKINDIGEGASANEIIAVGDNGVIYESIDAGMSFTKYTVGYNTINLRGVSAKNPKGSFGGSGGTLRFFTDGMLNSIKSLRSEIDLTVTPNPAVDAINISVAGAHEKQFLSLHNSLGKIVLSTEMKPGNHTIDVSAMEAGVYYLRADQFSTKVVITR